MKNDTIFISKPFNLKEKYSGYEDYDKYQIELAYIENTGYLLIWRRNIKHTFLTYTSKSLMNPEKFYNNYDSADFYNKLKNQINLTLKPFKESNNKLTQDLRIQINDAIEEIIDYLTEDLSDKYKTNTNAIKSNYDSKPLKYLIANPKKQFEYYTNGGKISIEDTVYYHPKLTPYYKTDENGLYCLIKYESDEDTDENAEKYYLRIRRTDKNYAYSIGIFSGNEYIAKTSEYPNKKPINLNDDDRIKYFKKRLKRIPPLTDNQLIDALDDIGIFIGSLKNYKAINSEFEKNYEPEEEYNDEDAEDEASAKTFDEYPENVQLEAINLIEEAELKDSIKETTQYTHSGDDELIDILILAEGTIYISNNQNHVFIDGKTGEGKTDLANAVIQNYPKIHIHHLRNFSPKNIYYDRDSYNEDYNIVLIDDVDLSKKDNIEIIKELTDNKKPVKELKTVKDNTAITFTLPGKYLIIMTSAKGIPDAELADRLFNTSIITNKDDADKIKHKISSNSIINANTNAIIEHQREINRCAITKLIESKYEYFNPNSLFINPEYLNNRDISDYHEFINSNTFYNVSKRRKIKILNKTIVLGNIDDLNELRKLWKLDVQKNKLNHRQIQILNLLPEWDNENAETEIKKLIKDFEETANNKPARELIENTNKKLWSRDKIAKELGVSTNTIKFDLDANHDDRTNTNLYELGLIYRYHIEDRYNAKWYYYKVSNNDGNPLNNDLTYGYIGTNKMYQSNIGLYEKISIIINILYRYNILINVKIKNFIHDYADSFGNIRNDDDMFDFLFYFFNKYENELIELNTNNASVSDIQTHMKIYNQYSHIKPNNQSFLNSSNSSDSVPIENIEDNPLNQNQDDNSLVHSENTNNNYTEIDDKDHIYDIDYPSEKFYNFLVEIKEDLPKTIDELKILYEPNPDDTNDQYIIGFMDAILNKFKNKNLIHITKDGLINLVDNSENKEN